MFKQILNTFYNPAFYLSVRSKSFGQSVSFFAKVCLWVSLVGAIIFSIIALPIINKVSKNLINQSLTKYPQELSITVKDGEVSTNSKEPIYLSVSDLGLSTDLTKEITKQNFLVIDTKSPDTIDLFKQYNTIIYVSKQNIYQVKDNDSIEISKIPSTKEAFVIDKTSVEKFGSAFNSAIRTSLYFLPLFIFVLIFIASFVSTLIGLLFYALVIWLIMYIRNVETSYSLAYKIGLHFFVPILIINLILFFVYPPLFMSSLLSLVLTIVLAFVNIKGQPKIPTGVIGEKII